MKDEYSMMLLAVTVLLTVGGIYVYTQQNKDAEEGANLPPAPPPLPDDYVSPEIPPIAIAPPDPTAPVIATTPPSAGGGVVAAVSYERSGNNQAISTGRPTPQFGVRSYR